MKVKHYNADEWAGRTVRWGNLPVGVHDAIGIRHLQAHIDDWNQALGFPALKVGDPRSPIEFYIDNSKEGASGAHITVEERRLISVKIRLRTDLPHYSFQEDHEWLQSCVKHELGHALGFFGHTVEGGVMASTSNLIITNEVGNTLRTLYKLPPGTKISLPLRMRVVRRIAALWDRYRILKIMKLLNRMGST